MKLITSLSLSLSGTLIFICLADLAKEPSWIALSFPISFGIFCGSLIKPKS